MRTPKKVKKRRLRATAIAARNLPGNWHMKICHKLVEDLRWLIPEEEASRLACASNVDTWCHTTQDYSLTKLASNANLSAIEFAARRQLAAIVDKLCLPGNNSARAEKAFEIFHLAEEKCKHFNEVGWKTLEGSDYLPAMKEFICRTIGPLLPDNNQLLTKARHGPGSVFGQEALDRQSEYAKYSLWPYSVTPLARKSAKHLIESDPRWLGALEDDYRVRNGIEPWRILDWSVFWDSVFTEVPGNKIITVPKDRSKDRTIAIEPSMNMMLQLGVDGFIRKRLRQRWSIDLNDQTKNQQWARSGSVDSTCLSPATLDLSMASDTISLRLAQLVLPEEWYDYLFSIRSPSGVMPDGMVVTYSKLSSMGNGSTFAIESLIFASVLFAVASRAGFRWAELPLSVYGDDLICPCLLSDTVARELEVCGFSLNKDKSFFDAQNPVRESCGADWYRAHLVRPVYIKDVPKTVMDLFHIHNSLWVWATGLGIPLDNTLAYVASVLRSLGYYEGFRGTPSESTNTYVFCEDNVDEWSILRCTPVVIKPEKWFWGRLLGKHAYTPLPSQEHFRLSVLQLGGYYDAVSGRWRKVTDRNFALGSVYQDFTRYRVKYWKDTHRRYGWRVEVCDILRDAHKYLSALD